MTESYDSKAETLEHMRTLAFILHGVIRELLHRIEIHDIGKLAPEEKDIFDEFTPKLKHSTYGSDEYKQFLKDMKSALDHHYATNRHHAEFNESHMEWRPIAGYEGHYEINNLGDVRSLDRVVDRPGRGDKVTKKGHLLKCNTTPKGYIRVQLTKDGKSKNWMVHRLVALTFLENPNNKPEVNHRDGIKGNNDARNLEWSSASENLQHAYDNEMRPCYVVHCPDLDITTIGVRKMADALQERGVTIEGSRIYNVMDEGGKVDGLTFEATPLTVHTRSRISWMNLVDLIEMMCDWYAATKRHGNGDLMKSVDINQERFGYGDELKQIFINTARYLQGETLEYKRDIR